MNITTLARKLEPYIRKMIREMLGDFELGGVSGGLTWIQGTGIPEEDKEGNSRGYHSIDMQLGRSADDEVASGSNSAILCGYDNKASAKMSIAAGYGAYADNQNQFAIGYSNRDTPHGDAQCSRFFDYNVMYPDNSWQTFASFSIRTDTAWTFLAQIVGIESGAARSYSYQIIGCIENDGGTTSLLGSTVTTIYEDDANFNVQAVADDGYDRLAFQVTDSGDNSRESKWVVHMITAEASYDATG